MNNLPLYLTLLFALVGCHPQDSVSFADKTVDGQQILENVLLGIDHNHPGRGLPDYPSDEPADVPKSYAMILLGTQADARHNKKNRITDLGIKAGNWLIDNADANRDGVIGWGVPVAWDAYGDGSVNPENTEYSISTAIVVDALLGWLDYVDDEKKLEILDIVEKALAPYLPRTVRTPAGMLPYSLLPNDRKYDTFNSAVYLAGQMQRYAQIVKRPDLKKALESAADSTMEALVKHKKKAPKTASWYWDYSVQENVPNDLPHAGYIIEGVITYIENNGRLSSAFNRNKIFEHLLDFFEKNGDVRGWPAFRPEIKTPPRLYDLSIATQLMCRFRGKTAANLFLAEVTRYASPQGGYLKYPYDPYELTEKNKRVAEYEAYLYRALMSCGYHGDTDAN